MEQELGFATLSLDDAWAEVAPLNQERILRAHNKGQMDRTNVWSVVGKAVKQGWAMVGAVRKAWEDGQAEKGKKRELLWPDQGHLSMAPDVAKWKAMVALKIQGENIGAEPVRTVAQKDAQAQQAVERAQREKEQARMMLAWVKPRAEPQIEQGPRPECEEHEQEMAAEAVEAAAAAPDRTFHLSLWDSMKEGVEEQEMKDIVNEVGFKWTGREAVGHLLML